MQAIVIPGPRWAFIALLTGSFLPVRAGAQQLERYSMTEDEVAIYNLAGEVRVEAAPGSAVVAQVARGGADAARLKVSQGELDGRETLRVIYPTNLIQYGALSDGSSTQLRVRDDGTFGDEHGRDGPHSGRRVTIAARGGGLDAHADLHLVVPPGKRVSVYLAVGKVSVTNVSGDLMIDAASAPVTASGTRGELSIDVGSGAVRVTQAEGDLSVDTGSGAVEVSRIRGGSLSIDTGSGNVTGSDLQGPELSIETGSGDIGVTGVVAPQVSLDTGSGSVTAELGGELHQVSVETGSGDVTLKVPPTLGADVEIQTSSGDIETDFPVAVTRHARDHMTGRIGDGRGKIAIETGSGGIKLVKGGR